MAAPSMLPLNIWSPAKITLPSDEILKGLIIKLLKDKGIVITSKLVDYVIARIERSYEAVNLFIQDLNNISLEKKKNISISLIKELIEKDCR